MQLSTFSYNTGSGWSEDLPGLDSEQTLVVAFGAPALGTVEGPLRSLADSFPRSTVIGCSTAGEILGTDLLDDGLVVAVARFDTSQVRGASAAVHSPAGSFAAGAELGRRLADPSLRAVVVLSDGIIVNGSELVRGLNEVLPASVVVTGGLAADGDRFGATWVLDEGRPLAGVVRAAGLYGPDLRVGHGSIGGWDIFGPERTITRSHTNVLLELDGRPALDLYLEYLGDLAAGLPGAALLYPLAVRIGGPHEEPVVRTILGIDEEMRSMTFAGDMPEGAGAQLMRANLDRLIDGAADAALMTRSEATGDEPLLAIAISCVGRRLVLGERTQEEIEAAAEVFPPGTQQVGFYSYGEISPHSSGSCELHNQTMTLTTIGEASQ